jgi:hypothetical protein
MTNRLPSLDRRIFAVLVSRTAQRMHHGPRRKFTSPSMARTSGDLVSGIVVVAEQRNREQDGDVERQTQGAGEGHRVEALVEMTRRCRS